MPVKSSYDRRTKIFQEITAAISVVGIMLLLVACQSVASAVGPADPTAETLSPEQILILGEVSDDPAETIEAFQPLADYLAANLTDVGIKQGGVVVATDLDTMVDYLRTGEVDLYFDSPYPALTVYEEGVAVPLLRRWKKGVAEYYTLIVARQDSGMATLDDLVGHTLAFEDESSTSGYLLPKAYMANAGYKVTEQTEPGNGADDEIGYVFARTEANVLAWTLAGKTAGGAISSGDYDELPAEERDQLVILAQTPVVPRHIVLASSNTDQVLQTRITELLLEMHHTPEGQAILASFEKTSRFDPLPGEAAVAFKSFQELFSAVR